jgi:hypothetical protein
MVIERFRNSAPGVSAVYTVYGHGLAALVRYIAREIQVYNFITATSSKFEMRDSVILIPSSQCVDVDLFKLNGKRTIVFVGTLTDQDVDLYIRDIASREEYDSIVNTFNLAETFMTDALSFPMPFSHLFRFLKLSESKPTRTNSQLGPVRRSRRLISASEKAK